ncbi:hypothetical protein K439DRAFT_1623861 [Ramaria rubella]|nr:hypothetical protein K439DRAFT_1623861 [Ramaria rubella]
MHNTSTMSDGVEPKSTFTTEKFHHWGQPPTILAMQPWQAQKRRHVPVFFQKPGCKATKRLARNSLFPANVKIFKEYMRVFSNQYLPDESHAEGVNQDVSVVAGEDCSQMLPSPFHDSLDPEELSMSTTDLSRWDNPTYLLCIEEMELFAEMLNILSKTCALQTWFCLSPSVSGYIKQALRDASIFEV